MNIGKYRVHRVNEVPQVVPVTFEGNTVHAQVMGLEVELTPIDDPRHGTLTLRFVGQSVEAAKAEFATDAEGAMDWTMTPEPAEEVSEEEASAEEEKTDD